MEDWRIRGLLPRTPPEGLISWALDHNEDDLGGEYMIFNSQRVNLPPDMQELMDNRTRGHKVWATRLTCTACNEDTMTRKITGYDGFYLEFGEDGQAYTVDYDEAQWDHVQRMQMAQGDEFYCPMCGSKVKALSGKKLKGGRTKRLQVASLEVMGELCAVVYWLVEREILEWGTYTNAIPRDAFVLDEDGKLLHFSHGRTDMSGNNHSRGLWERVMSLKDTWGKLYHDWGSAMDKKRGSAIYPVIPSLVGTSGEKTGLHSYWAKGGWYPVTYLRLWRKRKNVENLVNAGFAKLLDSMLEGAAEGGYSPPLDYNGMELLDLRKRKPYEILRLRKQEYRAIPVHRLTKESLYALYHYRAKGGTEPADQVIDAFFAAGSGPMKDLLTLMDQTGETSLGKIIRYLNKQGYTLRNARLLLDARDMARALNEGRPLTEEQLWPRHLRQVHDRLMEQQAALNDWKRANKWKEGFDKVARECKSLEWNDGELCVVLPKCNQDLITEGNVLRHCVGGYGQRHSEGENLIFFIRHYRRPERSYYTLNIQMGRTPSRVQLHGYGNERHGKNKEYKHKIPRKVLDFCDRWEKEVLRPYCKERYKANKEKSA